MPNLLVHILIGLIIAYVLNIKRKSIFLLGSILPDIKIFPEAIIFFLSGFDIDKATAFITPIHTPIGSILLAIFISSLFSKHELKQALLLLVSGCFIHLFLDSLMYPFYSLEHYLILYPFSWEAIGIGTGRTIEYLTIFSLVAASFYLIYRNFISNPQD